MGFGKFLGCVLGGVVAIITAPIVLPAAAAIGAVAATATGVVAGAAAAAGTAVASTAIGGAVVGAATAVGAVATGTAAAVGTAVASTAVGGAVVGAATTVGTAVAGAATAAGATIAGAATTVGGVIASSSLVGATTALEVGVAGAIGSTLTYTGVNVVEGFTNIEEAKDTINSAERKYNKQSNKLLAAQEITAESLECLNLLKLTVYATVINESIEIIKKIKEIKETQVDLLDKELSKAFSAKELEEMQLTANEADFLINEAQNGTRLAYAATSGTLTFVSQFGIASTGTAISQLSGAAAYNASIAALGGGALTAGGGGMALGHAVLGGIALAPAAVITSWNYAKNSEIALTEAKTQYSTIIQEVEKMKSLESILEHGINKRVEEVTNVIEKLVDTYNQKIYPDLLEVYDRNKDANGNLVIKNCNEKDREKIELAIYSIRKLKNIIAAKILDENGNPSEQSKVAIEDTMGLILRGSKK